MEFINIIQRLSRLAQIVHRSFDCLLSNNFFLKIYFIYVYHKLNFVKMFEHESKDFSIILFSH